ncbi:MAG TPA: glycosyltransferase family 4 protein [Ignavibacteria bacterium]|nr:glycosyltransferase family 4 protein [Ignavibacteria bacterium]HQY51119.1 glycosyltransferase family 4 protein [Ignavibacteria bacterium]HRA98971.1 glycosyltransferase family 4 protein [Ignavibacteria bacterium]
MKVAIYSGNIPSTTFIENLIRNLSNSGFRILLFGKKIRDVKYNENVEVHNTPNNSIIILFFILKESLKLFFKSPNKFSKLLKYISSSDTGLKSKLKELGMMLPIINNEPDIFHIQWAKTVQKNSYLFNLMKCRFALSLRGAHINYSPLNDESLAESYRKYFPKLDGFHAVSKAISIEAQKYGAAPEKIKVIYSSVQDELLQIKTESKINRSEVTNIISIGRYHWKKGYHYAFDAMKILIGKGFNFQYTIVAQGDVPEEILYILSDKELKSRVVLKNGMAHDELMNELKKSDMLLLPSVEEGIANVVLESMAIGVPVISTDCGGMNEAVSDFENGMMAKVRDPNMLAQKIIEYSELSENKKEQMKLIAKNTISEKFTDKKQIDGFVNFYNSLLYS